MKSISGLYLVTYNYNKPNLLNIIEDSLNGGVDIVEYMDTSGKTLIMVKKSENFVMIMAKNSQYLMI